MIKCNDMNFLDIVYEVFVPNFKSLHYVLLELWMPEDDSVKYGFAQF